LDSTFAQYVFLPILTNDVHTYMICDFQLDPCERVGMMQGT